MSKVFGLFCPYHKSELLDDNEPEYDNLPSYPRAFRKVRFYDNASNQLIWYTEVMCPASQMFTCEEEDLEETLNDLNNKFDNEEWLEVNVYPYI